MSARADKVHARRWEHLCAFWANGAALADTIQLSPTSRLTMRKVGDDKIELEMRYDGEARP